MVIGALALILSLLSGTQCEFVKRTVIADGRELSLGIWNMDESDMNGGSATPPNSCVDYPGGVKLDASWRTAKAFSVMAPIIGGLAVIWTCFGYCIFFSLESWKFFGFFILLCSLFEGLVLVFLAGNACQNSELFDLSLGACEMEWGAKSAIVSTVFWFVAGSLMTFEIIGPPTRPPPRPVEHHTVTYTKTTDVEGGTTIVTGKTVVTTEDPSSNIS